MRAIRNYTAMNFSTCILGPCAAETEEQLLGTALRLKNIPFSLIFRAGIWKPRTSPDSFQGIGDEGLKWLNRVQRETGLMVATEVATPEQVEKAMFAGIDFLWIGARTSANPIAVQEIADTIRKFLVHGTNHPLKGLFIKNPVNEDAALWIGNITRLQKTGLPVMAVHRGCGHQPCWRMAHQLRETLPNVPLLLDPSHMSGDAQKIPSLVNIAEQLAYDGLMMEVHPCPQEAKSDSQQQLTPDQVCHMLTYSNTTKIAPKDLLPLLWLRQEMDELDDHLWEILAKRMMVSQKIGDFKQQHQMEVVQPSRYQDILLRRKAWAKKHSISEDAVQQIFDAIHQESVRQQSVNAGSIN